MSPEWYLGAELSPDRKYRYRLWRRWAEGFPMLYWIMLNPSTADERKDDATIRRCVNFSRQWGFGGMEIYNLFAFRATCPRDLAEVTDAIGEQNDSHLRTIPQDAEIIAAWGAFPKFLGLRDRDVLLMLGDRKVHCLGMTAEGYPRHPVRLANATVRESYIKPDPAQAASPQLARKEEK